MRKREVRPWTDEKIRFLLDHDSEMTRSEIARILGRPANSVSTKAKAIGLGKKRKTEKDPFRPIEIDHDVLKLERDFVETLLAAWRAGHKDVGRVIDYFHTERRIYHGWQDGTKRFGMG